MSAIALAGSAISAGIGYEGQQEAVNAQNQSNADWVATQRAAAAKAAAADAANEQKQQAALQSTEGQLTQAAQQTAQASAQTALTNQMLSPLNPASDNSNVQLLGQPTGSADTSVTSDMASRVTDAAREAQGRIKALAGLDAYGSGYLGAQSDANQALANSAEAINMYGDYRKGDTATLGVTQAIQPVAYAQGSNIAGSIAGSLGQIAGKGLGQRPGEDGCGMTMLKRQALNDVDDPHVSVCIISFGLKESVI